MLLASLLVCGLLVAEPPQGARSPSQPISQVSGVVVDPSGQPVAGAAVRIESVDGTRVSRSGPAGEFSAAASGEVRVVVSAPGFADIARSLTVPRDGLRNLTLVLGYASLAERVDVVAVPGESGIGTAAPLTTVSGDELATRAGQPIDDTLRQVPGFSLFRLSSSRVANPTTQGVSLRGLGPSGASRAATLVDGVSVNDPFGGWVVWNRVPMASVERVEVARGGSSDRFGSDALGGVVQIITRDPATHATRAHVDFASGGAARGSLFLARPGATWQPSVSADLGRVGGYHVLARDERGPVDRPAGVRWISGLATMTRNGTDGQRVTVRAAGFGEHRDNGTPLQTNATRLFDVGLSARGFAGGGAWRAGAAASVQRYEQAFSAVSNDRHSEALTRRQVVPATSVTTGGAWSRSWRAIAWQSSVEWRQVDGESQERPVIGGVSGDEVVLGGQQRTLAFGHQLQLDVAPSLSIAGGLRLESWSVEDRAGIGRRAWQFSPSAALNWRVGSWASTRLAAYRGFRAPTLNELFRGFRVGNIVTRPNAQLRPEVLEGFDAGVLIASGPARLRVVGYVNRLSQPIANVTLGPGAGGVILRERQNLGRIDARGVEAEGRYSLGTALIVRAAAAFVESRIEGQSPAVSGRRTPLVPQVQGSAGMSLQLPARVSVDLDLRRVGRRYEDDRNLLPLGAAWVTDLVVGRRLGRRLWLSVSVENVADTEYDVGRTPLRLVGLPRIVHIGMRVQ